MKSNKLRNHVNNDNNNRSRLRGAERSVYGRNVRTAQLGGMYGEIRKRERHYERQQGPKGIFLEAFNRNGKIEEGVNALIENGIDPRSFGVEVLKNWAEEARKNKANAIKTSQGDDAR